MVLGNGSRPLARQVHLTFARRPAAHIPIPTTPPSACQVPRGYDPGDARPANLRLRGSRQAARRNPRQVRRGPAEPRHRQANPSGHILPTRTRPRAGRSNPILAARNCGLVRLPLALRRPECSLPKARWAKAVAAQPACFQAILRLTSPAILNIGIRACSTRKSSRTV